MSLEIILFYVLTYSYCRSMYCLSFRKRKKILTTKKINVDRANKMRQKTIAELDAIYKSGSLSAAAAKYELNRRNKGLK